MAVVMRKACLIFVSFLVIPLSKGNVDEEALLRAKAALVAQKVHLKNLNLIGVNPKTCKTTDEDRLIINQIKTIKSASLSHCPSVLESIIKPLEAEIAKVNSGVLEYAPLPKTTIPMLPVVDDKSDFQDSPVVNISRDYTEGPIAQVNDPEVPLAPTGLTSRDINRIFETYENNPQSYRPSEDDDLFRILSKAYVRNLGRLIERKRDY